LEKDSIVKKIPAKTTDVVILHRFTPEARVEYSRSTQAALSGAALEDQIMKNGTKEELDGEGEIIQIYLQTGSGWGLILENKTKDTLKMKLEKENLSWKGDTADVIPFTIKPKSKMLFDLKACGEGNMSFQFAFDE